MTRIPGHVVAGWLAMAIVVAGCNRRPGDAQSTATGSSGSSLSSSAPPGAPSSSATSDPGVSPAVASAAVPSDGSIDRLVARLAGSRLWRNGHFPKIDLPASAPLDAVVARIFEPVGVDGGRAKSPSVLESREVRIGGDARPYTALVVETERGKKVVLLRYEVDRGHWWSRVFDPE